jgi:hypothetical protein
MFQTNVAENIKTHFMYSKVPTKIVLFMNNVEGYGTDRQVKDDDIIRPLRFACRITKATDAHSEYVILIAFLRRQPLRERASVTFIRILPFFLLFHFISVYEKYV